MQIYTDNYNKKSGYNNKQSNINNQIITSQEQNYEYVLNKITQDEIKLNHLENKQNNLSQDINSNFFSNNPNISIKQTLPPNTSVESREIGILNNKIKDPWPISPNITPNIKGKVIIVNKTNI